MQFMLHLCIDHVRLVYKNSELNKKTDAVSKHHSVNLFLFSGDYRVRRRASIATAALRRLFTSLVRSEWRTHR